ncbi:MAG: arginine decarboxylase [Chitinophagaceae bacterium]|nr:MAG: arginine decarboxylase [Chitinophagaceae bacterium]
MKNKYIDLIEQTFYFPQNGFEVKDNYLHFHDLPLKDLIEEYGTPLRISFLPKISSQIQKAKTLFNNAIKKVNYDGKYIYCYCTKSSHFSFVIDEVLKNDAHLETSSAFDVDLIMNLYRKGKIDKNIYIVSNGFKPEAYTDKLAGLVNDGFENIIPVLDNMNELNAYEQKIQKNCKIGIRIAAEEEPNFEFYTSRLGIRYNDILKFHEEKLHNHPKFNLNMLHFFINTGIRDSTYYWSELHKAIKLYVELRKKCPTLNRLNIGGGMPIQYSLGFEFDYAYMIEEIVSQIQSACKEANVPVPDIFTEFGNFTVGESGIMIFSVLREKLQNDSENWYMIDGSLMTTLPDIWGISQRFILLPINKWKNEYQRVNIGGLSCDIHDYYNAEAHLNQVYLPKINNSEPLHLGFFHVGAYQDQMSGYGGIKHCLIPSPKYVLVQKKEDGSFEHRLFANEQTADSMLNILGY